MARRVSGYVTTANGIAIPDASVFIAAGDGPAPDVAAVSDTEGGFALDGIAPGTYVLRALGPGGEVGQVSVIIRDEVISKVRIILNNDDDTATLGE